MLENRRTKIVATIGPPTEDEVQLKRMIQAGMNVDRLNFSHGTHEVHGQTYHHLRDLSHRLAALLPLIGHVQFAGVPDRGPPDAGEVAYGHVFALLDRLGWQRPLGAEYKPRGPTEDTLGWMTALGRT